MMLKLKSRKLWIGIFGAVSPIVTQAITGAVGWPVAAGLSILSVVSYVLGQSQVDAAEHKSKAKDRVH